MPYRQEQLANNEIYHIVIRALDDNILFKDENDYFRMIFSVYEFNNRNRVEILERRKARMRFKREVQASGTPDVPLVAGHRVSRVPVWEEEDKRERLVDIFCFKWMPNHVHLLLKQLQDSGISKFMQKVGIGYSKYFNTKYQRQGHVLQDTFRAVHIKTNEQLMNVFVYIHTNALVIIEPGWKGNGIANPEKAKKFLETECRWTSYWDYLDKKNFPSVTERKFMLEVMGGPEGCRQAVNNWIDYNADVRNLLEGFFSPEELKLFE